MSQKKPTPSKLTPAKPTASSEYEGLLQQIGSTLETGRSQAAQAVYAANLETYWLIGQHIVEFEQGGQAKAEYGAGLIPRLAKDLSQRHGRGFSLSNVKSMRQFYLAYPKSQTLSGFLSWSHVVELLKIDDPLERSFYEKQMTLERWGVRELKRQKESGLFLRLAASKDKEGVLKLASRGQIVEHPTDLLREPYIFEFLKIPEAAQLSETELETRLCNHLQQFLLELGKGFTFVGRQYRVTLNNTHYRVDLVFYHRILRCFVLIDLLCGPPHNKSSVAMRVMWRWMRNQFIPLSVGFHRTPHNHSSYNVRRNSISPASSFHGVSPVSPATSQFASALAFISKSTSA